MRGYVIILVEGYFLEKFMNICTHRQIFLWDIKRHKSCVMTLKISIKGFKLLRPVARKSGCRVRIAAKRGVPFIFNRYRRRKTFAAGAVTFIAVLYLMSSFIWAVEVSGNQEIGTEVILERLSTYGIRPGVIKYGINTEKAVNELMLGIDELAWASMELKGTKVKVQVVERRIPPELVPRNEPCNIVARRDGVIKSVIVSDGLEMVKEGDTVVKGQVLISGSIPDKNEPEKLRQVHSIGTVKARTWYEGESPVTLRQSVRIRTGDYTDGYSLLFFGKRLHIYSAGVRFADYDKIEIKRELAFGEDMVFPFGIMIDRCYEIQPGYRELDEETARKEAENEAYEKATADIPEEAEITQVDTTIVQGENGLMAKVTIECLEDIGVPERMGGE